MSRRGSVVIPLTQKKTRAAAIGPTFYGSRVASQFVSDLRDGVNCLDIIVIGDSNSGASIAGSYGFLGGVQQALHNMGIPCYGTPIYPFSDRSGDGNNRFYGNWRGTMTTCGTSSDYVSGQAASSTIPAAVPYAAWNVGSTRTSYGSYTPYRTLSSVVITGTAGQFSCASANLQVGQVVSISGTAGGTGSISGYVNGSTGTFYYIIATNGSTTFTLSATLGGTAITTTAGTPTGLTYTSGADYDDWLWLADTSVNLYKTSGVNIREDHPFAANGTVQYYRVRYGKANAGSGRFYVNVWGNGAANARPRLLADTSVSLYQAGGQPTFDAYETQFTANGKGHSATAIGYDTNGVNFTRGPGALFCHSCYRRVLGFSVHCHAYQSGADSTQIAYASTNATNNNLSYLLKEIRERQILAGGTGRVLLFVCSGINGSDTATTWTNAHVAIWSKYKAVWQSLGYPLADLAIMSMVSLPRNAIDTSGGNADLTLVRAAAIAMPTTYPDMCVVDVARMFTFNALAYGDGNTSFYQRYNNSPIVGSDSTVHLSGGFSQVVPATGTYTATVSTATSLTLTGASAVAADGYWNGSELMIDTVNGSANAPAYQTALITQYNGTTKVATVNQWTGGQPTNGTNIAYRINQTHLSNGYMVVSQGIFSSLIAMQPSNQLNAVLGGMPPEGEF